MLVGEMLASTIHLHTSSYQAISAKQTFTACVRHLRAALFSKPPHGAHLKGLENSTRTELHRLKSTASQETAQQRVQALMLVLLQLAVRARDAPNSHLARKATAKKHKKKKSRERRG
jgi:hypothetical protein